MSYQIHHSDCIAFMRTLPDNSVDSIVTDPPYELGFMGKGWDKSGIANSVEMWSEALRILKPGGHLLAFSGSRTYHRMACAIEDAGFEVRDQIMWLYGSGFPKSHDVSKAIDKAAGAERSQYIPNVNADGRNKGAEPSKGKIHDGDVMQMGFRERSELKSLPATDAAKQWQGWGNALKPAHEPICVARKPLIGTVANNVLTWGTGAVNVDGCRVKGVVNTWPAIRNNDRDKGNTYGVYASQNETGAPSPSGRWPANVIHDGSEEVVGLFPATGPSKAAARGERHGSIYGGGKGPCGPDGTRGHDDIGGSAARFFYCAKASKADRDEGLESMPAVRVKMNNGNDAGGDPVSDRFTKVARNHHPTVKPTDLMRYLCRLVTPPSGTVFDPFTGSGSTGKAAVLEGFNFIGCDMTAEYVEIARARVAHAEHSKPNTLEL